MNVKITLRIQYEEPESKEDYKNLMEIIKSYFQDEITIPQICGVLYEEFMPVEIEDDCEFKEELDI